MKKYKRWMNYLNIVDDILNHEEFMKLKDIKHHATSRYDHSKRVSYYSYLVCKTLRLDYISAARAGLLHDFFLDSYVSDNKASLMLNHPLIAVSNSKKYFKINEKEIDIIKTHMFPINPSVPKYIESWIVCFMDDLAALKERYSQVQYRLAYMFNFYFLFMINFMK